MTAGRLRLLALGVALVAATAWLVSSSGDGELVSEEPARWRILWQVTLHADPEVTTQVELEIDRPYRSRSRTWADAPGGRLTAEQIETDAGVFLRREPPDGPLFRLAGNVAQPPSLDLRIRHALPAAIANGEVLVAEGAEHLGRTCHWLHTRAPLATTPWELPAEGDETRTCLDDAGRILIEERSFGGTLAQTMRAVELDDGAALTDAELFGGSPPEAEAGSIIRTTAMDGPAADRYAIAAPSPPDGFTLDRTTLYQHVDPATQTVLGFGEHLAHRRGLDLVTVDSFVGPNAPANPAGQPVETTLGPGTVSQTSRGTSVVVVAPGDVLVTVTGTVPLADLLAWIATFELAT